MATLLRPRRARVAALLLFVGIFPSAAYAQAPAQGLFSEVPPTLAGPAAVQRGQVRARTVRVDVAQLSAARDRAGAAPPLLVNLFPDTTFTAALDRIDSTGSGFVWVGHLENVERSSVTIAVEGTVVAGSIISADAAYTVRSAAEGLHTIAQVDQGAYPPEAPPIEVAPAAGGALRPEGEAQPVVAGDDGTTIDVMVLYTPAVATVRGGDSAARALANLGISETNTSYINSGIRQRVRLVFAGQVAYAESGDISKDLDNVRTSAGSLSSVGSLRNTYGADIVSLWVHYNSAAACGIGYVMTSVSGSFAPAAFNVVEDECVSPNYSFAHEMGHNMGASHDWYVTPGTAPYSYAHGYVNTSGRWRTVMAYGDQCGALGFNCARLLYWANPTRIAPAPYPAMPMGVPAGTSTACTAGNRFNPPCDADDARTLDNTAFTVANFRQTVGPPLSVTSLAPSAPSPARAGSSITWLATSSGGTAPIQYKFLLYDSNGWTTVRDWNTSSAWTWSPASPGTYYVQVWARNAASNAAYDAWLGTDAFVVDASSPLTVTGLTSSPASGVVAGTSVVWSATASGGTGPYTYKFYVFTSAGWLVAQDWSSSSTWTWMPNAAGIYYVQVWARNAGSSTAYDAYVASSAFEVVGTLPLTVTGLTASTGSGTTLGGSVVWSASASGGTGPLTYKFYVFTPAGWIIGQDWSPSSTWTWTPDTAGSYYVQAWVRNAGSVAPYDAYLASAAFDVVSPPLTVISLTSSIGSIVSPGSSVLWSAATSGGTAPLSYKFYVLTASGWVVGQDWSASSTWTWTAATPGVYYVQVWVRNAGSTATYDAWSASSVTVQSQVASADR